MEMPQPPIGPVVLRAVQTGRARPYTRPGSRSAIDKQRRSGPVRITAIGLEGDEQGDPRVHGGPGKAIHHYPLEHYAFWRSLHDRPHLHDASAFGENFSTSGWTERDVCLGDVVAVGSAVLEVSQARQPCWKLNDRLGHPDVARVMQESGRTGWYYRVLTPGVVEEGDEMRVLHRPHHGWPLSRLLILLFDRVLDPRELMEALKLPLPDSWNKVFSRRLDNASLESWAPRLGGPPA